MDALFDSFDVIATAAQPVPATPLSLNLETDLLFPILSAASEISAAFRQCPFLADSRTKICLSVCNL